MRKPNRRQFLKTASVGAMTTIAASMSGGSVVKAVVGKESSKLTLGYLRGVLDVI